VVTKFSHYHMLLNPRCSGYSWTMPALLTRTGSHTSLGFSPIVGLPAVIKHNFCHHHHQGQAPWWRIAASTVRCHFHNPELISMLGADGCWVHSELSQLLAIGIHDCLGQPVGRTPPVTRWPWNNCTVHTVPSNGPSTHLTWQHVRRAIGVCRTEL